VKDCADISLVLCFASL